MTEKETRLNEENKVLISRLLIEAHKKAELERDNESLRKIIMAQAVEIGKYTPFIFGLYCKEAN